MKSFLTNDIPFCHNALSFLLMAVNFAEAPGQKRNDLIIVTF